MAKEQDSIWRRHFILFPSREQAKSAHWALFCLWALMPSVLILASTYLIYVFGELMLIPMLVFFMFVFVNSWTCAGALADRCDAEGIARVFISLLSYVCIVFAALSLMWFGGCQTLVNSIGK